VNFFLHFEQIFYYFYAKENQKMQNELSGLSKYFYDLSKIFVAGAVANGIFTAIKISDVFMLDLHFCFYNRICFINIKLERRIL
jgi:hypothetical protein